MSTSLPYVVPEPWGPEESLPEASRETRQAAYGVLSATTPDERVTALARLEYACKYELARWREIHRKANP